MQLDPTANIANTNFELWESPHKSINKKCKQNMNNSSSSTTSNENGTNSDVSPNANNNNNDNSINSSSFHEESDEENFHIDPYVSHCAHEKAAD